MAVRSRRPEMLAALAAGLIAACSSAEEAAAPARASEPATVTVGVGSESLEVELATDPESRFRGLSGRAAIARNGGMLFVLPRPEVFSMVMRNCPNPIDVAFIDSLGRVVAIHEMQPEPPRKSGETPFQYERRLPGYDSGEPVQFALETAGGLLAETGLAVGDRVHFDAQALIARAR